MKRNTTELTPTSNRDALQFLRTSRPKARQSGRPPELHRDGWEIVPPTPVFSALIKRCSELPATLLEQTEGFVRPRNTSGKTVQTPYATNPQLMKSVIRGILRFHPDARLLAHLAATRIRDQFFPKESQCLASPPYPYLHPPGDELAESAMHRDSTWRSPKFQVSWTPLNSCPDGAISIVPRTHRRLSTKRTAWKIACQEVRVPLLNPNVVTPILELGESLTWSSLTYHAGLLNTAPTPHCAINTKIIDTGDPISLEPSLALGHDEVPIHQNLLSPVELASILFELVDGLDRECQLGETDLSYSSLTVGIERLIDQLVDIPEERSRLSFALSMAASRVPGTDPRKQVWNLAATLLAPEHLGSFVELAAWLAKHRPADSQQLFTDMIERYPFRQVADAIRLVDPTWRQSTSLPTDHPVYGWA